MRTNREISFQTTFDAEFSAFGAPATLIDFSPVVMLHMNKIVFVHALYPPVVGVGGGVNFLVEAIGHKLRQ